MHRYLTILFLSSSFAIAKAEGIFLNNGSCHSDTINVPVGYKTDTYPNYNPKAGKSVESILPADLFVKVSASRRDCYVGEPVMATYKLYSRVSSSSRITRHPRFEGFDVYDTFDMISIAESSETVRGIHYKVHTIRKSQLVPLQTGLLNLDPIELLNTIHHSKTEEDLTQHGGQLNKMLNQLLDEEKEPANDRLISIKSQPLTITVKALPDLNRPASFTGAVGRFTIKARLVNDKNVVNEPNVLRVELTGSGDWKLVDAPDVNWPPDIESMDVRSIEEIGKGDFPLEGTKVYEYSFITRKPGSFSIPIISFAFFDPVSSLYHTIKTQPILLKAELDINSIKPRQDIMQVTYKSPGISAEKHLNFYLIIICGATFILGLAILVLKMRLSRSNNLTIMNENDHLLVGVTTNDPLLKSRDLLKSLCYPEFYMALQETLLNIFKEKLQLPVSDVNKSAILSNLKLREWNTDIIREVDTVLTECERQLYLPEYQSTIQPEDQMQNAEKIVTYLQNIA